MRQLILLLVTVFIFSGNTFAQDTPTEIPKQEGRPNFPGTLYMDLGMSYVPSASEYFKIIGSRTANFYYLYDFPIKDSKFSFHAGLGLGLDRYQFADSASTTSTFVIENDINNSSILLNNTTNIKKSLLAAEYVDIPIEFRFSTNAADPGRSFNVALGFKAGYLFRGKSKIKYVEDELTKKIKDIQKFHLNDFRYGTYLRVGTGGFNVFANYTITPLFKEGEGPFIYKEGIDGPVYPTMNTWTFGISFVGL